MTPAAIVFLGLAALFAVADWYAVAYGRERLEYICKPATVIALVAVALALDPEVALRRVAFVVALAWSLLGDVFLMVRRRRNGLVEKGRFVPGLASFLVAHLAYIVGFQVEGGPLWLALLLFVVTGLVTLPITVRLLSAIRTAGEERLAGPVRAYAIVISGMVAAAAATGKPIAIVGAVLFLISDLTIAWTRFVRPLAWAPVAIIVTYHFGQAALVLSLI